MKLRSVFLVLALLGSNLYLSAEVPTADAGTLLKLRRFPLDNSEQTGSVSLSASPKFSGVLDLRSHTKFEGLWFLISSQQVSGWLRSDVLASRPLIPTQVPSYSLSQVQDLEAIKRILDEIVLRLGSITTFKKSLINLGISDFPVREQLSQMKKDGVPIIRADGSSSSVDATWFLLPDSTSVLVGARISNQSPLFSQIFGKRNIVIDDLVSELGVPNEDGNVFYYPGFGISTDNNGQVNELVYDYPFE